MKMWMKEGEKIYKRDEVKGMIIVQENDDENVMGEYIEGQEEDFERMMKKRERKIGMKRKILENNQGMKENVRKLKNEREMEVMGMDIRRDLKEEYELFQKR